MNTKKNGKKDSQRKLELKKIPLVRLTNIQAGARPPASCTYC
jgi:hypothetical protein